MNGSVSNEQIYLRPIEDCLSDSSDPHSMPKSELGQPRADELYRSGRHAVRRFGAGFGDKDFTTMFGRGFLVALWFLICVVATTGAGYWRWSMLAAEHAQAGATAHRIISQRADQHDAHVTGLSALALATQPPPVEALRQVAASIMQFYPRIVAIDLVGITAAESVIVMTTRDQINPALADAIRQAAMRGGLTPELIRSGSDAGRYLLIKRVPNNTSARYALALEIDAARLASEDTIHEAGILRHLAMPDGSALRDDGVQRPHDGWLPSVSLTFIKPLGSNSQPLVLDMQRTVSVIDLVPWSAVSLFSLVFAAALAAFQRYNAARRAERDAIARAAAREQEVRLAHASRVNAMGELALGIAHEMAQPLAAMMSQSQAGLHMMRTPDLDCVAVTAVLDANVRHAKRAGEILGRLRSWVAKSPGVTRTVKVNAVARDVVALTGADLASRGITISLELSELDPTVIADPVELEQITYNLVTNAADASPVAGGAAATIHIRTAILAAQVILEVRDEGPGVSADVIARLFEPFFTTKPDGMGLGLALCRRLAEKFRGEIHVDNHPSGGAVFSLVLPAMVSTASENLGAAQ